MASLLTETFSLEDAASALQLHEVADLHVAIARRVGGPVYAAALGSGLEGWWRGTLAQPTSLLPLANELGRETGLPKGNGATVAAKGLMRQLVEGRAVAR